VTPTCVDCGVEMDPEVGARPWCIDCSGQVARIREEEAAMARSWEAGSPDPLAVSDLVARLPERLGALLSELPYEAAIRRVPGVRVRRGWVLHDSLVS